MAVRHRGYPKSPLLFFFWVDDGAFYSKPNCRKVCMETQLCWVLTAIHFNENSEVITANKHTISKPLKWYYDSDRPYGFSVFIPHWAVRSLSTCQLWLSSGDTQQVWVGRGLWEDPSGTSGGLWHCCEPPTPPPNFSTAKSKEMLPRLESSFPTPIPKSVIKCWC